jgi:hypothetical protein
MPRSNVRWLSAFGVFALLVAGPFEAALWRSVHHVFMLVVAVAGATLCMASAWQATHRADGAAARSSLRTRLLESAGAPLRSFGSLSDAIYLVHIFAI